MSGLNSRSAQTLGGAETWSIPVDIVPGRTTKVWIEFDETGAASLSSESLPARQ